MKIALVHDWLTSYGGAEKVIEALCRVWPTADILTLVHEPEIFRNSIISHHRVRTSFIQHLPWATRKFRHYFPFYPLAVEQFDLRGYDVILSCTAGFSHGIITEPDQIHICYKYTPMRYAWSGYQEYLNYPTIRSRWKNAVARWILHRQRMWDFMAAQRADEVVAISREIQWRIWKYYRRTSALIYPPVEVDKFLSPVGQRKENFYLTISRLVPYKKIDLIVQAFTQMPDRRLIVAGEGPELKNLQELARGASNIEFAGFVSEGEKVDLMRRARAFIFAAYEDFGIVPVEAQAAGTPVIAYGSGGSLETVQGNKTGVFFGHQTPESLVAAVHRFERMKFDPQALRDWVEKFSVRRFQKEMVGFVETTMNNYNPDHKRVHSSAAFARDFQDAFAHRYPSPLPLAEERTVP